MPGDVEGGQALTQLDAIGNTTKAITKGIATAVPAATTLFGSLRTPVEMTNATAAIACMLIGCPIIRAMR